MEEYQIDPVRNKKELKEFIMLPWKIYKHDPFWVSPLIIDQKEMFSKEKHPFHKHSEVEPFICRKDGEPVGRVVAILNRNHNNFHNERTAFFGFYESYNDPEACGFLINHVKNWAKERGMERIRGPMNFSTNEECGLLIEGFNLSPVIMMTYNPKYYIDLFESNGLKKIKELFAWRIDKSLKFPDKWTRIVETLSHKEKIKIRSINMKDFKNELERINIIYNDAWSNNWGFVPMTDEEFNYLAKKLKQIVDPRLVFIAEVEDEPAGFSLALPDVNVALKKINGRLLPFGILKLMRELKKVKKIRVITLGVRQKFRFLGIDSVFYYKTITDGIKIGYEEAEMSWVLEDNVVMNRLLEKLGGQIYKKYAIYEKEI
ncbi:MAG: hypothetical protein AB1410_08790 [Acidobacteriota bacterium]